MGDEIFHKYIHNEHIGQIIHQLLAMSMRIAIYGAESETGILYEVLVLFPRDFLVTCHRSLHILVLPVLTWAHEPPHEIPSFVPRAKLPSAHSRFSLWHVVNSRERSSGRFPPLNLFKHCAQTFYSKTKTDVDGVTQLRAILRSPTSSLQWEEKLVCEILKTVELNVFIAHQMYERRDILFSIDTFK